MKTDLDQFLARCAPVLSETVTWNTHTRLRVTAYLEGKLPPLALVTGVRAVVFRDDRVLVQEDYVARHILPGGHREDDEALEATVRREVSEETGWTVGTLTPLGFVHLVPLDVLAPGALQVIFATTAVTFEPAAIVDDGVEVGTEFVPLEAVQELPVTHIEQLFLAAALQRNGPIT